MIAMSACSLSFLFYFVTVFSFSFTHQVSGDSATDILTVPDVPTLANDSSKCSNSISIKNGNVKESTVFQDNELKHILVVTCDPGFELIGNSEFKCENGVWEKVSNPVCLKKCERPSLLMNGALEVEGLNKKDGLYPNDGKALYVCNSGFYLFPSTSAERLCKNGSWTRRAPVCIPRTCSRPESIENGFVVDQVMKDRIYTYGSKIRFDCEDGYTLKGPVIATCNEMGHWTPNLVRECVSNVEASDTCPPPPKLPYVKYTQVEGVQTANSVLSGSVLQTHCIPGYRNIRSPCSPTIITCHNGLWIGEFPSCQEVDSCFEPASVSHDGLRFSVAWGSETTGSYRLGSKVIYECLPGYSLHGEAILTCSKSGCWEPNVIPKCAPQSHLLTFTGHPVDYVSGTLLVTLLTAVTILLVLLGVCLVSMRHRTTPQPIATGPPPTLLQPHPDRLALIAFTDAVQVGQAALPSYEEAIRDRFSHRFHRPPQWTQPARRAVTRQSSSVGGDSMGSTDTMTNDSNSTNVTLDTVSSHSGSQTASCRAICGSLASFDTSSVINTEGVPLLEESEQEENGVEDNESGSFKSTQRVTPELV